VGVSLLDGLLRLDGARGLRDPKGFRLDFYLDAILQSVQTYWPTHVWALSAAGGRPTSPPVLALLNMLMLIVSRVWHARARGYPSPKGCG
jgi:hypothetical protein